MKRNRTKTEKNLVQLYGQTQTLHFNSNQSTKTESSSQLIVTLSNKLKCIFAVIKSLLLHKYIYIRTNGIDDWDFKISGK
jgi:hypothetical protein